MRRLRSESESSAAVCLDGRVAGATADVAAPVVLAVAATRHVRRPGHVTAAATHRPTSGRARAVITRPTFPAHNDNAVTDRRLRPRVATWVTLSTRHFLVAI